MHPLRTNSHWIDRSQPTRKDWLARIQAVSVNPVNTKVRAPKNETETIPHILGWGAAGEVVAAGPDVKNYAVGDQVYYAGDITRSGSNGEYQLVDERVVGRKPASLIFDEVAALPLTGITAWEGLFEWLGILSRGEDAGKSILIIGGAECVGSIAIQLAKQLAKLNVIATASCPESIGQVAWGRPGLQPPSRA